jgi:hypothetical protein
VDGKEGAAVPGDHDPQLVTIDERAEGKGLERMSVPVWLHGAEVDAQPVRIKQVARVLEPLHRQTVQVHDCRRLDAGGT